MMSMMMMMMITTMTVNLTTIAMSRQDQEEEGEGTVDIDDNGEEEDDLLAVTILTRHPTHLIHLTMTPTLHTLIIAVATALMNTQPAALEEDEGIAGGEKR